MKVTEDSKVVSFTRAEHDDEAETHEVEQPTEEELKQDALNSAAELSEAENAVDEPVEDEE